MTGIEMDPEVYDIERQIRNHLVESIIFASRDPYFIRILALFITREILTQKKIQEITGISAGKVSEEINRMIEMNLLEEHKPEKRNEKIIYKGKKPSLIFLNYSKHVVSNMITLKDELISINKDLESEREKIKQLEGYNKLKSYSDILVKFILAIDKINQDINNAIKQFQE